MMNSLRRYASVAALASVLIAGCGKSGSVGSAPGGSQPSSTFPVYTPSTIASVAKYDDSAEVTQLGSSFFGEGQYAAYPFIGTQELIKTNASIDQLEAWVGQLVKSPPQDLTPGNGAPVGPAVAPSNATPSTDHHLNQPFADALTTFGLVPAEFWSKDGTRAVMIIVLDPKRVADRVGATFGVIDMWEKMPGPLRAGLDQTIKKQVGFSASDLTNTATPLGMIVYAARNWKDADARAIILVDANRQPNPLPTPHASP